jgi:hypothetical protein
VRGETELGLSVTVVTFCVSQHLNSSQRYLIQCRSSTLGVAGSPQVVQQFTLAVQTPSAITGYSAPYNEHSSTNTVVRRRTHCWCQHHEDQKKNRPNNKMSAQTLGVRGYWCLMKYRAHTYTRTHTHTHTSERREEKKRVEDRRPDVPPGGTRSKLHGLYPSTSPGWEFSLLCFHPDALPPYSRTPAAHAYAWVAVATERFSGRPIDSSRRAPWILRLVRSTNPAPRRVTARGPANQNARI